MLALRSIRFIRLNCSSYLLTLVGIMYCTIKISKKMQEVVSELEYIYPQFEQCVHELIFKDLTEDITLLLRAAWKLKCSKSSVRDIVEGISREFQHQARIDCLRDWVSSFSECLRRHTWSRDLIANVLLHYIIKASFKAVGLHIVYDVIEPVLEVKPPAIIMPFIEILKKTSLNPLFTYKPDSYMFCRYGDKCAHIFLEYKLHRSCNISTIFQEDIHVVSKFTVFLHGLDLTTSKIGIEEREGEKLAIEINDSILVCSYVTLYTIHITPNVEKELSHRVLIHQSLLREPGVVKRLRSKYLSHIISISNTMLIKEYFNMLRNHASKILLC